MILSACQNKGGLDEGFGGRVHVEREGRVPGDLGKELRIVSQNAGQEFIIARYSYLIQLSDFEKITCLFELNIEE